MSAIALIASVFRSMSTVKRVHAQEHGKHKTGKCGRQGRCRRVILRSRYAPIDKDTFLVNISSEREDVYIYYSEAVWQFECLFDIVFFINWMTVRTFSVFTFSTHVSYRANRRLCFRLCVLLHHTTTQTYELLLASLEIGPVCFDAWND